jgi:hypothetical protein
LVFFSYSCSISWKLTLHVLQNPFLSLLSMENYFVLQVKLSVTFH